MSGRSAYREAMTAVVTAVTPLMKQQGFRKRSRTFNRSRERGAIAVLNFQMGRFDPPGTVEIPGFRWNLYGRFTVNLGIAFEEMWEVDFATNERPFPPFVHEYDCHLRRRLGDLLGAKEDLWWSLSGDTTRVAQEVASLVEQLGLPWLDRLDTRRAVLLAWETGKPISEEPRLPLVIAFLYLHEGDAGRARSTFREYYESPHRNATHAAWLHSLAPRFGINDLPGPSERRR